MYKIEYISNISKFRVLSFNKIHLSNSTPTLWGEFWKMFFSVEKLTDFFNNKFDSYQKFHLTDSEYYYYQLDRGFILSKLETVIKNLDFTTGKITPTSEDVFISYRVFNTILGYYNTYYSTSHINLNLSNGISFTKRYKNVKELVELSHYYEKTPFFQDIIIPLYKDINKQNKGKILFHLSIFWPDEMILIILLSKLLKFNTESKVVLNLSGGNEQFDFSQWKSFLLDGDLFDVIDFFIIDKDYGKSIDGIIKYIEGTDNKNLVNVIYKNNNKIIYEELKADDKLSFEQSNTAIFNINAVYQLHGKKSITSRLSPYKCYWNKCNFCAINSQNKLEIHEKYDYKYYIDRWIKFIKDNNIEHVSFVDEAIPPLVLFNFAKAVLKNNLKITYFLRTRIERFYQKSTLKLLQESGARFWGMGLESASDNTNELIGNKGNGGLSIKEKGVMVRYMDQIGISVHNYAILGFPGESEEDYLKTYVYLKNNIIHSRQFTCSPNIFRLMKGPEIFRYRDKYGIEIDENQIEGDFNLSFDFTVKGKKRNLNLLNKLVNDLHRIQFAPWLPREVNFINYQDYWAYIDRSEIFYIMKNLYKDSPYYTYKNVNINIINRDINIIKKSFFYKSQYYVKTEEKNNIVKLYDWISCKHLTIHNDTFTYIENYDEGLNFEANLKKYNDKIIDRIIKDIYLLFDAKILKYYR